MSTDISEKGLESLIVRHMTGTDGLAVTPGALTEPPEPYGGTGYFAGSAKDYQLYYLELSEILRGYLGGRWGFDSLELTTTELTEVMKRHLADEELRLRLQAWLEDTDLVKFANLTPEEDEAERAWDDANAFVIVTKPVIVVEAAAGAAGGGTSTGGGAASTSTSTSTSTSASTSTAGGAA